MTITGDDAFDELDFRNGFLFHNQLFFCLTFCFEGFAIILALYRGSKKKKKSRI
jgi:hypothetical protein